MANEYEVTALEDALIAALKTDTALGDGGVVGGRIFARAAVADTAYPYIVVSAKAPRVAIGNSDIEVLSTYAVLASVYGRARVQNGVLASKAKVKIKALAGVTLTGGALLMGAVIDPKQTAAPGSGIDSQRNLIYSDSVGFLVFVEPVQTA